MRKARRHQTVRTQGLVASRRPRHLPPPESESWPEYCRGTLWDWESARFFVGRCQLCAYSCPPPATRRRLDKLVGLPTFLLCTNHPDSGGALREVMPTGTCRNFKVKCWRRCRARPAQSHTAPTADESDPTVRRIPVGQGLFATVDAADYPKLRKYRWYAYRHGRKIYAVCHAKGRTVYMHRMIMGPRKGYLVDHIDGNGLNNRRCNLRFCTAGQNRANSRPCGGVSGFVGVYPKGNKWRAGITYRGVYYYLGLFDDPVEAAKARDRKAYELHGPYAYLNFPEDFRCPGQRKGKSQPGQSRRVRRAHFLPTGMRQTRMGRAGRPWS